MMISIYDGTQLLEERECRSIGLPDGREGAIWRGLAYPVLAPGAKIDVGGEGIPPGACAIQEPSRAASSFAVIEGKEEAYVLLSGLAASCDSAAAALRTAGYDVLRTGRYLGDPVAGVEADWFVRFTTGPASDEPLQDVLARLLGMPLAAASGTTGVPTAEFRARLVAMELSAAKAREAGLRAEVARLRLALAGGGDAKAEVEALRLALDDERRLRTVAEAAAQDLATDRPALVAARPAPPAKLRDEIESVIGTLLRRVSLARDSLTVISAEFANRRSLYRTLQELQETKEGRPVNWKKVQGVDGWWERHVSNGQDDSGRAYARWDGTDKRWEVLVSHKGEQTRDMEWLARQ